MPATGPTPGPEGIRPHARLPWEAECSPKRPPQDVAKDLQAQQEAKLNAERQHVEVLTTAAQLAASRAQQNASTTVHNIVWETDRRAQSVRNETQKSSLGTFLNISLMRQNHWQGLANDNAISTAHRYSCEASHQTAEARAEEVAQKARERVEEIRREEEKLVRAYRGQADRAMREANARCVEIEKESRAAELAARCRVTAANEACAREIADLESREQLWTEEAAVRAQKAQEHAYDFTHKKLKELENSRCAGAQRRTELEAKFEEEHTKFVKMHQDADASAAQGLAKLRGSTAEFEKFLEKVAAEVRAEREIGTVMVPVLHALETVKLAMRTRGVITANPTLS